MRKADLILTADWHIRSDVPVCRTDNYMEAQKRKIKFIEKLSEEHEADIVLAGDLFHKWNAPIDCMNIIAGMSNGIYAIPGNHDLPQHNMKLVSKSAFGLMVNCDKVGWLFKEVPLVLEAGDDKFGEVFGVGYGEVPDNAPNGNFYGTVLVWHTLTYKKVPPFPGCEAMSAKDILKAYPDYDLIVTGDNHHTFVEELDGRLLVNPGSLMRMTADQESHKPCVFLWFADDNTVQQVFLPTEDNVIDRTHIERKQERENKFDEFLQQLSEDMIDLSFEDNLRMYMKANKVSEEIATHILESME